MELVNTNDENSFDPTPKLKSSPIPILFVSFNKDDQNCFYCGDEYTKAIFYRQKYCKKCLSCYNDDNGTWLNENICDICEHGINRCKCSNCYLISSGWVKSTLTKKSRSEEHTSELQS